MDFRLHSATSPLTPMSSDMAQRLTKPVQKAEAEGHGFSTALENALRAVSDQPEADRWVTLYCGVRLGKLLVEIQNPCAEGLVMRDGLPVSERAGHGYGCRSIQTIAERRGGLCEFRARGGIFSMQLVLPIKAAAKTQD